MNSIVCLIKVHESGGFLFYYMYCEKEKRKKNGYPGNRYFLNGFSTLVK